MLALRAARAFTGRSTILTFAGGYHGSHDYAGSIPAHAATAPGGPGIPAAVAETVVVAPYGDAEAARAAVEPHLGGLAAVIVEPVLGAGGVVPATAEFLGFLRDLTQDAGALLIFDEVIAFRIGYHGAQGRLGVTPDLTTLGKIIGGGLPVGACGGRADVMELFDPRSPHRIGHGGTFNANPLTATAGIVTLDLLTPERYDELESLTAELKAKVEALTAASIEHIGSLFRVELPDASRVAELHIALLNHGILLTPRGMGCLSTVMTSAEIDAFAEAVRLAVADLD